MMSPTDRVVLVPGVFFTRIGDRVYVRNVNSHFDYLFNATTEVVLNAAKESCTFGALMRQMSSKYRIDDLSHANQLIQDFLISLSKKGIVSILSSETNEPHLIRDVDPIADRVEQYCHEHKRLWSVCLEITYRCNEKCRHCYLDNPEEKDCKKELSTDTWFKIIDEMVDLGAMSFLVTGGEPTLRPDFLEICRHIVSKGVLLDVFTNALRIPPDVFEALATMKLNSVSFSLYGGSASFHDYVTQVPGSFDATLKNLLAFKSAGVDVFVKTVPFNGHFDEYESLYKLCKLLNIRLNITQQIVAGHSGKDNCGLMYSEEEFRKYVEHEIQNGVMRIIKTPSGGFLRRDPNGPTCKAGHTTLSVDPYGNVSCCNSYPVKFGNLTNLRVKDVWEKSPELKAIREHKFGDVSAECTDCIYSGQCSYCPGAAYQENAGSLHPCRLTCRNAKIQYDVKKSLSDSFAVTL